MYNRASQSSASTYFLRQWVTGDEEEEQATRDSHLLTTIDQEMLIFLKPCAVIDTVNTIRLI